jgi:hypothetical protein
MTSYTRPNTTVLQRPLEPELRSRIRVMDQRFGSFVTLPVP